MPGQTVKNVKLGIGLAAGFAIFGIAAAIILSITMKATGK
jgi:hypothetical protein